MAKKTAAEQTAYGTRLKFKGLRSNHPIKSRYMAAFLAMVFGIIGANQFYLRNIVKGLRNIRAAVYTHTRCAFCYLRPCLPYSVRRSLCKSQPRENNIIVYII